MKLYNYAPPSCPLLVEGEMVYKIIAQLNTTAAANAFRCYDHIMSPRQVIETMIGCNQHIEAVAKNKADGRLYRISTSLLGYVGGTRVEGGQEGGIEIPILFGYQIQWHRKNGTQYTYFEDETRLLPLKNIIILDPESLRVELMNA